jgi:hypothetical protein
MAQTISPPAIKPAIKIDSETKTRLAVMAEQQVIVHGTCYVEAGGGIRIWPSTYLLPKGSQKRCKLIHSENIGIYPEYLQTYSDRIMKFTLIFEGLPSGCSTFDLREIITEPGGFEILNVSRNDQDVYHLDFD